MPNSEEKRTTPACCGASEGQVVNVDPLPAAAESSALRTELARPGVTYATGADALVMVSEPTETVPDTVPGVLPEAATPDTSVRTLVIRRIRELPRGAGSMGTPENVTTFPEIRPGNTLGRPVVPP